MNAAVVLLEHGANPFQMIDKKGRNGVTISLEKNNMELIGTCVGGVGCHLIIYLCKNYWGIMAGFALYGLGIGMGYYPILKTTWKYFPEKKRIFNRSYFMCFWALSFCIYFNS